MASQLPDGEPAPSDGSLPPGTDVDAPVSLYVHVPFCKSRCGYCDFNTYTAAELGAMSPNAYLFAARAELNLARRVLGPQVVRTVFFGGGTPTMLPPGELVGLLDAIRERFPIAADAEITTEANPESVDPSYFQALRDGGFTRISLGYQSSVPHVLRVLDRQHSPGRGLDAAHWASEAGFEHVSLDLIYGTPGESLDDWRRSLDAVADTPVDHVSAYSLIVEEGTRLALRVRKGELAMPDEDDLADKYMIADEFLTARGFHNYETSNWALPGGECRHNIAYWKGANWWGIGPGAHSHVGGVRFWNRKHPRAYADALAAGKSPAQGREVLTAEDRRVERVLLELRLADGLPLSVLTPSERARIPSMAARGLVDVVDGRLIVRRRLLADGIIRDLLD
ncbi:radical SAM family heme chaperone HemW [uncultured Tessaracoccus sp.]|uniref:radical SAM family heme chaperone HemW n=1 Tax=uncultured Tessaracoccus sp. TaxID=905023 RepID=UPI00261FCC0B|nr:radical SAM family heme chaperone HemW [uncultured Tessaracoccus sp.]